MRPCRYMETSRPYDIPTKCRAPLHFWAKRFLYSRPFRRVAQCRINRQAVRTPVLGIARREVEIQRNAALPPLVSVMLAVQYATPIRGEHLFASPLSTVKAADETMSN